VSQNTNNEHWIINLEIYYPTAVVNEFINETGFATVQVSTLHFRCLLFIQNISPSPIG